MTQGDVCWHTFREPDKRRPVLVLTNNELIPKLTEVTVAPITTTVRDVNSQVWLDEDDGMGEQCAVNLLSIQTISKGNLGRAITRLSLERMHEVREAIEFAFDLQKL